MSSWNKILITNILILVIIGLCGCRKTKTDKPITVPEVVVEVNSLNVTSGPYNTMVQINGKYFDADMHNDSVFFNDVPAQITWASENKIVVNVPLNAGTGKVIVSVNGIRSSTGPVFTYIPAMMITTYVGTNGQGIYDHNGGKYGFYSLSGIASDKAGNIYAADQNAHQLIKIEASGRVIPYWGTTKDPEIPPLHYPYCLTTDNKGNVYVVDVNDSGSGGRLRKILPDGTVKKVLIKANGGYNPIGSIGNIVVDPDGVIFVTTGENDIRKIDTDGTVTILAGGYRGFKDDVGTLAGFENIGSLAMDNKGNLYTADLRRIRKITKDGVVTTFAGGKNGGSKDGTGTNATFEEPGAIVADSNGNIYIADSGNKLIRKITPNAVVTTIAGNGKSGTTDGLIRFANINLIYSITIDGSGMLYTSDGEGLIRKIGLQ